MTDLVFYVVAKKQGRKEVKLKHEDATTRKRFAEAETREWKKQIDNKAVRVLSPDESRQVENHPKLKKRILGSRSLYPGKCWKTEAGRQSAAGLSRGLPTRI